MANKYKRHSRVTENRMCWRKVVYETAEEAAGTLYAYRCPVCGNWHRTKIPQEHGRIARPDAEVYVPLSKAAGA